MSPRIEEREYSRLYRPLDTALLRIAACNRSRVVLAVQQYSSAVASNRQSTVHTTGSKQAKDHAGVRMQALTGYGLQLGGGLFILGSVAPLPRAYLSANRDSGLEQRSGVCSWALFFIAYYSALTLVKI